MGFFGGLIKGIGGAIKGGIGGLITGGPTGAIGGAIAGAVGGGRGATGRGAIGGVITGGRNGGLPPLPQLGPGGPQQRGRIIVDPGAVLPGGRKFIRREGSGGLPMVGSIGDPPDVMRIERRVCPTGQVLAIDGNCYPKSMVPKRLRMHPPEPRPVVSRSDAKAIRRANSARKRLVKITKEAGAHASLNRPTRRK